MKSICAFDMLNEYFKFNRLKNHSLSVDVLIYIKCVYVRREFEVYHYSTHFLSLTRKAVNRGAEMTVMYRKINFKNLNLSYLCGSSVQDEVWRCREHFQSLANSQWSSLNLHAAQSGIKKVSTCLGKRAIVLVSL